MTLIFQLENNEPSPAQHGTGQGYEPDTVLTQAGCPVRDVPYKTVPCLSMRSHFNSPMLPATAAKVRCPIMVLMVPFISPSGAAIRRLSVIA